MPSFRKAPISLATWTTLSLNLSARDKLVNIIQYVARILRWYYQRIKAEDTVLETIQKVRQIRYLTPLLLGIFLFVRCTSGHMALGLENASLVLFCEMVIELDVNWSTPFL